MPRDTAEATGFLPTDLRDGVLSSSRALLSMTGLGLDEEDTKRLKTLFSRPHGLIVIAGPTGSGKTTTLYSALREINIMERR